MTEHDFEQFLRAGFREMADDAAPSALRANVLAIPEVVSVSPQRRPAAGWGFPPVNRFAPLALAATAVIVAILIGISLLVRPPNIGPSPIPAPTHSETLEPNATPDANPPLGGALILVHEAYDQATPGPLDVFLLDAGSGQKTLLGSLPGFSTGFTRSYTLQWGADRKHVLITSNSGNSGIPIKLDNLTDAARDLIVICCEPGPDGGVLSPESDRIASVSYGDDALPGCLMCADAAGGITVLDLDGGNLRTLPLPEGTRGFGFSWSPDGSAVVVSGCRPCNNAGGVASAAAGNPGGDGGNGGDWAKLTPTAIHHAHLFIVPVDGSPMQQLFDEAETTFGPLAWSPDGKTIAFGRNQCPADEHAPYCQDGPVQLMTMAVTDWQPKVVAEMSGDLAWSPDGGRLALGNSSGLFVMDADGSHLMKIAEGHASEPRWSPDGEWLLYSTYEEASYTFGGPWIVAAAGGEPHLLGSYGGWAW